VRYIAPHDRTRARFPVVRTEMRQARVRRRVVHTPIARYQNPRTGRTVTIIATMHVGAIEYFDELNEIIARLAANGALICYEGVATAGDEEWAAASDGERAVRGLPWAATGPGVRELCRALGWVSQNEALSYSSTWRNVDTTDLNLIRQARPDTLSQVSEGSSDLFAGLTPERTGVVMASLMALLERVLSVDYFDLVGRWSTRDAPGDAYRALFRALGGERERGALASLPPDADAALVWGTGHLRALSAGLRNAGYRHRGTTWVPVGELPAFWPSLRIFLAWLRSPGDVEQPQPR
jgi:hypothetical protein